jgi:hypothetical protein
METGVIVPRLPLHRLKEISIPLPPLGEQLRIAAVLRAIRTRIKALEETQTAIEAELAYLERAVGFGAEGNSVLGSREAHGGTSTHLSHARDAELVHA